MKYFHTITPISDERRENRKNEIDAYINDIKKQLFSLYCENLQGSHKRLAHGIGFPKQENILLGQEYQKTAKSGLICFYFR